MVSSFAFDTYVCTLLASSIRNYLLTEEARTCEA